MIIRKLKYCILFIITAILLDGCSIGKKQVYTDNLDKAITYDVYNSNEEPKAEVLSVFNSIGNVNINKSNSDKLKVSVKLVQNKKIRDIDKKLKNLLIKPQIKNDVLFYEPLHAGNSSENYWEWIRKNLNANGIYLDFTIEVPNSIKELRVFSDTGNINLTNISAKIYAQTEVGSITGKDISPIDAAVFKNNIAGKVKDYIGGQDNSYGVNVSFSDISSANNITAGSSIGNVALKLPSNSKFMHSEIKPSKMSLEYPYRINSKQRVDYITQQCLEPVNKIDIKHDKTVITTTKVQNGLSDVLVSEN